VVKEAGGMSRSSTNRDEALLVSHSCAFPARYDAAACAPLLVAVGDSWGRMGRKPMTERRFAARYCTLVARRALHSCRGGESAEVNGMSEATGEIV
jgi:hypothetical protein